MTIWSTVPFLSVAGAAMAETSRPSPSGAPGRTERILESVLEAMVPSGGPFDEGARDLVTVQEIESFVAPAGASALRALRLAARLIAVSPFFLPPLRMRRFSRLPLAERIRLLDAWEQSRLPLRRQVIRAIKLLLMSHFYSRPEVAAQLRYPHPLERVPRSGELAQ